VFGANIELPPEPLRWSRRPSIAGYCPGLTGRSAPDRPSHAMSSRGGASLNRHSDGSALRPSAKSSLHNPQSGASVLPHAGRPGRRAGSFGRIRCGSGGLRRNTPSYRADASEDICHHRADLVLPQPEPSGVAEPCRATIPEQLLPWADGSCSMLAKRRENGDTGPGVEFGLRRVEQPARPLGRRRAWRRST